MSVEIRIRSALKETKYKPAEGGDHIAEVDIPEEGLTEDDILDHPWVEDVFYQDDDTFHVYVNADMKQQVFFETV